VTILINVPLSLFLLFEWGMVGAAIGTSIAMVTGSAILLLQMHRAYRRPIGPTLAIFWNYWPALLVCLLFGTLFYLPFEHWISGIHGNARFAWRTRVTHAFLSVSGYAVCLGTMLVVQMRRGLLSPEQLAGIGRWFRRNGESAKQPTRD
jgi:peptidoglycan biosynthesis protein MviN/MurJ (putative lipid II flippase)